MRFPADILATLRTGPGRRQLLRRLPHWASRLEMTTLVLLVLMLGGIFAFAEIAEEVIEGETHQVDEWILLALRSPGNSTDPLGPRWLEEVLRDMTALGGIGVLTLVTLAVAGFLIIERKYRTMALVLAAVLGGILTSLLLKSGFDRPRPDLVPHGSLVYTASFPSGHSMLAAVTYLTLGALLARTHRRFLVKTYILAVAFALTLLVGLSRVYLGVHWPTDVLAGWTAGAVWALGCWVVARWLQLRGQVEPEGEPAEDLPDADL